MTIKRNLSMLLTAAMIIQLFTMLALTPPRSFAATSTIPSTGLPEGWSAVGITSGSSLGAASAAFSNKQFRLSAENGKMDSNGDNVAYAYLPVDIPKTGETDFTLTARISDYTLTSNNSWAVLMVKDGEKDLTSNSSMVSLGLQLNGSDTRVRDYRRLSGGAGGASTNVASNTPIFIKLTREDKTLRFQYSSDGINWSSQADYNNDKNNHYTDLAKKPLNIGFAVSSATASFDKITFVVGGVTIFDSETTIEQEEPPTAPEGLTAVVMDSSAVLSWSTVTGATYYNIKSSLQEGGPYTVTQQVTGGSTTATEAGLTNGTPYYYVVSAANPYGESTNSEQITVIPTAPSVPGLFELSGFAAYTTGGGILPVTDPNYYQVYNAIDLGNALRNRAKVIEIMNDLDLGWNELPQEARKAPFTKHNDPLVHPVLLQTGVSKITVEGVNGLTIFSNNGSKIRHASLTFKNSSNIIIRNLEFDELWEWDEATKGDYDRNDWDYISLEERTSKVWIDHCTFNKAYDGVVDAKGGSNGITISWSKFLGDDQSSNSWVTQQFNELEKLPGKYPMYSFLRSLGFSKEDIIAVQAGQKKGHLIGSSDFASDNAQLELTLHHNYYDDMMDRIPRLRGGNAHIYNIVVDSSDAYSASQLISAEQANAISAADYHFGVISNGAISTEGGALLIENSIITDVLYPLRNNQRSDLNSSYTGKIKASNLKYVMDGETFTGDSDTPGSPLAPVPAEAPDFSWNLSGNVLPYLYEADDISDLADVLTSAGGAGAGQIFWDSDNWLRTEAYSGGYETEPTERPARVGGLRAEPGDEQVTLRWGTVGTADSYTVYSIDPDTLTETVVQAGITDNVYTITGLTNGSSYTYFVRAVNPYGESNDSSTTVVTRPFKLQPPGSPLLFAVSASTKILLDWEETPYTDYYIVKRSTISGGPYTVLADPVYETKFEDQTALEDTTYYYVVIPVNSAGEGDSSSERSASRIELINTDKLGIIFEDNFNHAEAGTHPDGYLINEESGAGSIQIANIPSSDDRSLQFYDDRSGVVQMDRLFEPQKLVAAIEFDFMQEAKANSIKVLRLAASGGEGSTSNGVAAVAIETNGGNLAYRTNAGYESILSNYSAGTWYNIKIVADIVNQKADIYVDGVLVKEQIAFFNSVEDIAVFQSFTANNNSANTYYLDNIKVYAPVKSATPVTGGSAPSANVTTSAAGVHLNVPRTIGTAADGEPAIRAAVSAADWRKALQAIGSGPAVIHISMTGGEQSATILELSAASIQEALASNRDIVLKLGSNYGSYELPLRALNLEPLLQTMNAKPEDAVLSISLQRLTGSNRADIEQDAADAGLKLISDAVSYSLTLHANGSSTAVTDFGGVYITRTLNLDSGANANAVTGVLYDAASGSFSFVPAIFTSATDGGVTASLKRSGNSIYAVVKADRSFADMNGHWAQKEVEKLASKLLINGITGTAFAPDRDITRAEFAVLLTRALGLTESSTDGFRDVSATDWHAGAIGAASAAGLIQGFEDGSFRPNAFITREQLAAMIVRAIEAAAPERLDSGHSLVPLAFKDSLAVSQWAMSAVAEAARIGIIKGDSAGSFNPGSPATRAEAAIMLDRLLIHIGFIE